MKGLNLVDFLKSKALIVVAAVILGWILSYFLDMNPVNLFPSDSVVQALYPPRETSAEASSRLQEADRWSFNVTEQKVVFFKPGLELYIHRAFRDDRMPNFSTIRIFGLERLNTVEGNFSCIWLEKWGDIMQEVSAKKYLLDISWPDWGDFYACGFDCRIPKTARPRTIHLVSKDHDLNFELKIEENSHKHLSGDLAVCVKPLTGKFTVPRIIEWIETQRLIGIKHFILYETELQGPARFVLDYYHERDIIIVIKFPFLSAVLKKVEPPQLSPQDRYAVYQQVYLVAYQDCLYRFRKAFRFLQIIDMDEIMLPTVEEPWLGMLDRLTELNPMSASFLFSTSWHFEESGMVPNSEQIADYLYMQRYAISNEPADKQPKSVVVTSRVVTINYHTVVRMIQPHYKVHLVPWTLFGYVHHYRGACKGKFQPDRCAVLMNKTRVDPTIARYNDRVSQRVQRVLEWLQLTRT